MKLNLRLMVDYYLGGLLQAVLKPVVVIAGKIMRRDHNLSNCRDVTFIKMLGGGSLVIAYPALLAIRSVPPIRRLQILTTPEVQPFAELLGIFDEIIVIRDRSVTTLFVDSLAALWKLRGCDAIVDLEIHSRLTTVFSLLTCARNRIGFYTHISFWRKQLLSHLLFCNVSSGIYYFYDQIAGLFGAEAPGAETCQAAFRTRLNLPAAQAAASDQPAEPLRIGLAPCCSGLSRERMLAPREWLDVLRPRLAETGATVELHLLGSPSEQADLEKLAALIRAEFPRVSIANHAGIKLAESVQQLAEVSELFCIDSALLHFARLLGTPTTSFWGPSNPQVLLRPSPSARDVVHYHRLPCSPCIHVAQEPPCGGNNICMRLAAASDSNEPHNPAWLIGDESVTRFHRSVGP